MTTIIRNFIILSLMTTNVYTALEKDAENSCYAPREDNADYSGIAEDDCNTDKSMWLKFSEGIATVINAFGITVPNVKLPEINFPERKSDGITNVDDIDQDFGQFYNAVNNAPLTDQEQEGGCYNELGCFPNKYPWFSVLRPFPLPLEPSKIDTKIYLYTSKKPKKRFIVTLWKKISIENSDFDPNRPYTVFMTHGFASNGNVSWLENMKDVYLKRRNANVFIVDWGNGASNWNYLQVAANTRVVGSEVKRFGQYLVSQKGLDPRNIHMIGHSLGAHILSYAAKGIPKIKQLTALDPAQPGFEYCPDDVRLKKTDAEFVDVLHTNTRPIIPLLGFGLILPTGHIDYYLNGGLIQPGCKLPPIDQVKLNNIFDLGKYSVEVISEWVACSHGRSYQYYTEALENDYCTFWGRSAGALTTIFDIASLGKSEKYIQKFNECTLNTCSPIGFEAKEYPARGIFLVSTHSDSPYCRSNPKITTSMEQQRIAKAGNEKKGITEEKLSSFQQTLRRII